VVDDNDQNAGHHKKCKYVTQLEYYAFQLFTRVGEATTLFCSVKLFQQFIVDA
jgi:hypothetical protein